MTVIAFIIGFYKPVPRPARPARREAHREDGHAEGVRCRVELTPEQSKRALDELLQGIADSTNELSTKESALFQRIVASAGRDTACRLLPKFQRDTPDHQRLSRLRDLKLIAYLRVEAGDGTNTQWCPSRELVYDL
ncbi:MAG: hypothetical protein CV089_25175 [Nitrospira sp. WS110]|nr:hypothetical protein [Nitrospira sp. WS110]